MPFRQSAPVKCAYSPVLPRRPEMFVVRVAGLAKMENGICAAGFYGWCFDRAREKRDVGRKVCR